jgi:hypothetical protein
MTVVSRSQTRLPPAARYHFTVFFKAIQSAAPSKPMAARTIAEVSTSTSGLARYMKPRTKRTGKGMQRLCAVGRSSARRQASDLQSQF